MSDLHPHSLARRPPLCRRGVSGGFPPNNHSPHTHVSLAATNVCYVYTHICSVRSTHQWTLHSLSTPIPTHTLMPQGPARYHGAMQTISISPPPKPSPSHKRHERHSTRLEFLIVKRVQTHTYIDYSASPTDTIHIQVPCIKI